MFSVIRLLFCVGFANRVAAPCDGRGSTNMLNGLARIRCRFGCLCCQWSELLMERYFRSMVLWLLCPGLFAVSTCRAEELQDQGGASLEFFEKEVRPILVARCYECHSTGNRSPKGGLTVDSRDGLLRGGDTGPAVSVQKPTESLIVSAINYGDLYQMPPKSKLPADEIAVLTKWVTMGIPWPNEAASSAAGNVKPFDLSSRMATHWCWQPLNNAKPPAVLRADWPVTAVDRFILARLEANGINPSSPAGKRTLLRRVYFDLTGLPPTSDEVEAFVADVRPEAYDKVVDRLLNSLHFGERWGRHWLDLTRYAETRGHEFEPVIPNAWQYRDYVIRALNADVPYDRFLTEHIAGDLIEPRWRNDTGNVSPNSLRINESILGTGFWFLGEECHSPVDIRKDETDRIDNRIDVLSKTFLGLTVACARCHDHKFDAISQRDYYALAGYALGGSYRQVRVDTSEQHHRIATELDELRTQSRREIARRFVDYTKPVFEKLDRYLLVARQEVDNGVGLVDAKATTKSATCDKLTRLATGERLDERLLGRWCSELALAKHDERHPLYGLFRSDRSVPSDLNSKSDTSTPKEVVIDFGDPEFNSPIQDGVSFGLRPIRRGRMTVEGSLARPTLHVATVGGWERDPFWNRSTFASDIEVDHGTMGSWRPYGRMVRTPEFTLTSDKIWYQVRGAVRAYVVVNSHLIVVGPLHGSVMQQFDKTDDQWRWVSHDLTLYRGHRMHVEFSPVDDGTCSIAKVMQCNDRPKSPEVNWAWLEKPDASDRNDAGQIAVYAKLFANAVASLNDESDVKSLATDDSRTESMSHRVSRPPGTAELADWVVTHPSLFSNDEFIASTESLSLAETELAKQVQWESTLAPAMLDGNGVDEYLLVRGNSNSPKEPVARRFLEAFQSSANGRSDLMSDPSVGGSGRAGLARDILRTPLAARVAVNRIWHHLFGRGIVPTVDNMGVLGLAPSHPELLDHLANEFATQGWSTKTMIRSLVLSNTYRMSSHSTDADSLDPDNELWHRMPIKRLEGESIRDSILAVSGRLDRKQFGPSVPIHLTDFMQGRGRPGASGPLDGDGRRSIYIAVRRNFLSPMMSAFDTPSPFSTVGRRTVSNVPAQALILMNDPFIISQATLWADHVLADTSTSAEQRIDSLYVAAFARHPTSTETAEAMTFLAANGAESPDEQRDAWSNLCHVLFNVKDFVFIE